MIAYFAVAVAVAIAVAIAVADVVVAVVGGEIEMFSRHGWRYGHIYTR